MFHVLAWQLLDSIGFNMPNYQLKELISILLPCSSSITCSYLTGDRHGFLNWKQRFNIIVGMARGLAYLHQEFHVCIIHRDIKSSNILLDDDFQPRIADFGLARLLPEDQSHLSTKFAGTLYVSISLCFSLFFYFQSSEPIFYLLANGTYFVLQ